ncbi:hypothetical protein K2173_017587 [Erythroxylum novogranatense]|uniref:CASP-like protein n=1 Tax=Erythroxylum novogranatense TaxID=1862640 RepID=A0AAV8TLA1_9ROSI|nr:hypothetical protein K2173_017587 [Erythroxylum novogranatense]
METNNKDSVDGIESGLAITRGYRSRAELLLRVLAFALTLTATVVLGVDKQTKVISIKIVDTLPAVNLPVVAKWHYLSAFVYFVVANAIACSYSAISIVLSLGSKKGWGPVISVLDLFMVALLFSGNGAAAAIGLLGSKGNSHVRWNKVCNMFSRFCNQVAASAALSLVGSVVFLLIVVVATLRLHKRSQ